MILPKADDSLAAFGRQVLGPVIGPFAVWAAQRLRAAGGQGVFALMRDGEFLLRSVAIADPERVTGESRLWLGRRQCLLAVVGDGSDSERLKDFLVRARGVPCPVGQALADLGIDAAPPLGRDETLDEGRFPAFAAWLASDRRAGAAVAAASAQARAGVLAHLKRQGALDGNVLTLLDVGYAGNIARTLALIFAAEGLPVAVRGLYLVTSPGIAWAERAGVSSAGFLAEAGQPSPFAGLFIRHREVVEALCATPFGPLVGYAPDGSPQCAPSLLPVRQLEQVARVQAGALEYIAVLGTGCVPEADPADGARRVLSRLFLAPLPWEAEVIGGWAYEDGLAVNGIRRLAGRTEGASPGSRDDVLWPAAAGL